MTRLVALLLAILVPTSLRADDWPTVHHDPARTGFTADAPTGPWEVSWVREFPDEAIATRVEAIVADGRVFVGTLGGTLWALDRTTGEVLWRHVTAGPILHSPTAADGRVIVADAGGTVRAVDATSGKEAWTFRSGPGGFAASPLVVGGRVYIGSRDGWFHALDAGTGKLAWKHQTGGPIRGTAAWTGHAVVFGSDDMCVHARNADGKPLWKSDKLAGQSFRDYYPVVAGDSVIVRSVPVVEFNEELNGGTQFLQAHAGVVGGWRELEKFFHSDASRGTPEQIEKEQRAILTRLETPPHRKTCFVLDRRTGKEVRPVPVLYVGGNQGCGIPPALDRDGKPLVVYRTVYGHWSHGVKPAVGVGRLNVAKGRVELLRHRQGHRPPWNTFWGTSDETTTLSVGGDTLFLTHQGTLASYDLKTGDLRPVHGERDTWGGYLAPTWAANEWHGPARGAVAISNDQLFWVTGGRIICLRGGVKGKPKPAPKPPSIEAAAKPVPFSPTTGIIRADALLKPVVRPAGDVPADHPLKAALVREVTELLDVWPWAPWHVQMGIGGRDFFFQHPSEAVRALALAYPHLPPELAKRAQERMKAELAATLKPDLLPADRGTRRELYDIPPGDRKVLRPSARMAIGRVEAVWLYGDRTGDWKAVEALWPVIDDVWAKYLAAPLKPDARQGGHPDLNRTLAGCIAYARLVERFGKADDAKGVRDEVERLAKLALDDFRKRAAVAADRLGRPTSKGDVSSNPGRVLYHHLANHYSKLTLFADLPPELARAFAATAPEESRVLKQFVTKLMPTYYLAFEERAVHYAENFIDLPDSVHGLFLAHALLWKADRDTLARQADIPWVKGDLYHVEKLVLALEQ